jgi:hypothetical protein
LTNVICRLGPFFGNLAFSKIHCNVSSLAATLRRLFNVLAKEISLASVSPLALLTLRKGRALSGLSPPWCDRYLLSGLLVSIGDFSGFWLLSRKRFPQASLKERPSWRSVRPRNACRLLAINGGYRNRIEICEKPR